MQQQLITMLELQEAMNSKVNLNWRTENFEWYRAIWVECAELMDHFGWKWWKKQSPDVDQVILELIDIWHFGLSIRLLTEEPSATGYQRIASAIEAELNSATAGQNFREDLEAFTLATLQTHNFCVTEFCALFAPVDLNFEQLFNRYVGKNVLNMFRQDFGYQDGSYLKVWNGKEDNEHLVEILANLDPKNPNFGAVLYQKLQERYPS
ncbi:dUTP diphosphatase [Teredinibacter purpureus]|uniref:dUTP diphosphatase n=1 Tax=Teredinibacter purpureus TaxID=2731756 RepID=UPI0005F83AD4|nr:dUTP diphosphatase [Teredinibacter purpureus]